MSEFAGIFSDWELRHYTISHEKRGHVLWVANGLLYFKDDSGRPFLTGFSWRDRRRLWHEYRREVRRRALAPVGGEDGEN